MRVMRKGSDPAHSADPSLVSLVALDAEVSWGVGDTSLS